MTMVSTDTAGRYAALSGTPAGMGAPIKVERCPSEVPLLFVTALVSAGIWLLAAISIFGLAYAAFLGAFFFVAHAAFVAHVRGSAVRLGPDQFPELNAVVESLAHRMGMARVPEVYLMQAGGTLNALASKFMRANIVVLFSDLLEACGDDTAARDMIIAHELGHLHAGHLRWTWFLIPGSIVPFLGTALSRAREYTCDRYGLAGAGRRDSALVGLAILAAGGTYGPKVNLESLVRQRDNLNTGWMKIGEWLSTHPPLASRIAALDPSLDALTESSAAGTIRGLGIVGAAVALPVVLTIVATMALANVGSLLANQLASDQAAAENPELAALVAEMRSHPTERVQPGASAAAATGATAAPVDFNQEMAAIQAKMGLESLANVVELEKAAGSMPWDLDTLYLKSTQRNPDQPEPRDPYDGERFGYQAQQGSYLLWSVGPDKQSGTADDIVKDSRRP
jgi:Zn-dependent protease with chaperone function